MAQFVDGQNPVARPIRSSERPSPNSRRSSVSSFPGIGMGTDSLEIADTNKENGPPHPPTAPTRSSRHNVSSSRVGSNTNQCHAPQPRQFQSNAQQADHHRSLANPNRYRPAHVPRKAKAPMQSISHLSRNMKPSLQSRRAFELVSGASCIASLVANVARLDLLTFQCDESPSKHGSAGAPNQRLLSLNMSEGQMSYPDDCSLPEGTDPPPKCSESSREFRPSELMDKHGPACDTPYPRKKNFLQIPNRRLLRRARNASVGQRNALQGTKSQARERAGLSFAPVVWRGVFDRQVWYRQRPAGGGLFLHGKHAVGKVSIARLRAEKHGQKAEVAVAI